MNPTGASDSTSCSYTGCCRRKRNTATWRTIARLVNMKIKLSSLALFVGLAGILATSSACKDENEEKVKTLAPICERSTEALASSSDLDGDTFMQYLENALKSCSAACDAKHDPSCKSLDGHIEKLCKAMPDACGSFCNDAKGSLKDAACKHAEKG